MRTFLKTAAEGALLSFGVAQLHRRRMTNRVLVLAYHNVVPDNSPLTGDLPNHLPLSAFSRQLAEISLTHDVVPLIECLQRLPAPSRRPRLAITLDDAYAGAVSCALPELVRRGLPATVFVAPGLLGGKAFWWDRLAEPGGGGLDPGLRSRALIELRGHHQAIEQWAKTAGVPAHDVPPAFRSSTESELLRAATLPGITFGSHSFNHPNLSRLSGAEVAAELVHSLAWLRERAPNVIPWLAYPYGLYSPATISAAREAGYVGAVAVSGGWLPRGDRHDYAVPRLNVPARISIRGFVIRAAGLFCR